MIETMSVSGGTPGSHVVLLLATDRSPERRASKWTTCGGAKA